jgi:hypothetical protein
MRRISSSTPGGIFPGESDTGVIHSLERGQQGTIQSADLTSAEYQISLPQATPPSRQFAALTNILGKGVTTGNPVWTSAAVPGLRALQKLLVDHALKLPKEERGDCLGAIKVSEGEIKLRLRMLQMHENNAEMAMTQGKNDKDGERV